MSTVMASPSRTWPRHCLIYQVTALVAPDFRVEVAVVALFAAQFNCGDARGNLRVDVSRVLLSTSARRAFQRKGFDAHVVLLIMASMTLHTVSMPWRKISISFSSR